MAASKAGTVAPAGAPSFRKRAEPPLQRRRQSPRKTEPPPSSSRGDGEEYLPSSGEGDESEVREEDAPVKDADMGLTFRKKAVPPGARSQT